MQASGHPERCFCLLDSLTLWPPAPCAEYDDADWPGPKVWPGSVALISFFALNVFLQGLRADLVF